jgi:serralysin
MAIIGGPTTGTSGNDFLLGTALDLGSNGIDNSGDSGLAAILGNGGDDIIVGDLFDQISYDTEGDELHGGAGNDLIFGDTAPDLSAFGAFSPWVGDATWDTRPEGSSDTLYGDAGQDTIYGGAGFDVIYGGTGADKLYGQNDADSLYGDEGNDQMWGGSGNDQAYGGAGADSIWGEDGNDRLYGEAFSSSSGDGGDTIRGGAGDDDIRGGAGADKLFGDDGDDQLTGGGLSSDSSNDLGDVLSGGSGNDVIDGNYGNDVIIGGAGADTLVGGDGNDRFVYKALAESRSAAFDIITDFHSNASDRIDLSAIDAIPGGANDPFVFRGAHAFTGAGQVRVVTDTANNWTYVLINTDTDTAAEMKVRLNGLITLDKADFIL